MSVPKEKLYELIEEMNELEISEIIDFTEYINNKRQKLLDEAFNNVPETDEPLTEDELKSMGESKKSGSISYKDM